MAWTWIQDFIGMFCHGKEGKLLIKTWRLSKSLSPFVYFVWISLSAQFSVDNFLETWTVIIFTIPLLAKTESRSSRKCSLPSSHKQEACLNLLANIKELSDHHNFWCGWRSRWGLKNAWSSLSKWTGEGPTNRWTKEDPSPNINKRHVCH